MADNKKLTFAELTAIAPADLFKFASDTVKLDKAVSTAKTKFTETLQFSAKVVAAMKRLYVERLNKRDIPADTTFRKYFEQNASGALPGRVEALAALFNALCLTLDGNGKPLLTEACFDAAAVDWLEKANAIVNTSMKEKGDAWKTCDDVLDVINALSKPGDALKALKEIRKRQKGEKEPAETTAAPTLTVGIAIEFLTSMILGAGKTSEEQAEALYLATLELPEAWSKSGVSDDNLNAWTAKFHAAQAAGVPPHMEIITSATPPVRQPAELAA